MHLLLTVLAESSPSDHEEGIPAAKRWKNETATGDTPAETVELNTRKAQGMYCS